MNEMELSNFGVLGLLVAIIGQAIALIKVVRQQGINHGALLETIKNQGRQIEQFSKFIEAFDSMKYVDEDRLQEKQDMCRSEVDSSISSCRLELNNEIALMRKDISILVEVAKRSEESREKHSEKNEKRWDDLNQVLREIASKR